MPPCYFLIIVKLYFERTFAHKTSAAKHEVDKASIVKSRRKGKSSFPIVHAFGPWSNPPDTDDVW